MNRTILRPKRKLKNCIGGIAAVLLAGCGVATGEKEQPKLAEVSSDAPPPPTVTQSQPTDTGPECVCPQETAAEPPVRSTSGELPFVLLTDRQYIDATKADLEKRLPRQWDGKIEKEALSWSIHTDKYDVRFDFQGQMPPPAPLKGISIEIPNSTREDSLKVFKRLQRTIAVKPKRMAGPNYDIYQFDLCRDSSLDARYSWMPGQTEKRFPVRISLTRKACSAPAKFDGCDTEDLSPILFVAPRKGVSLQREPGPDKGEHSVVVPFNEAVYPCCREYVYHGRSGYKEWIEVRWQEQTGWLQASDTVKNKQVDNPAFESFAKRFIDDVRVDKPLSVHFATPVRFHYHRYDRSDGTTEGTRLINNKALDAPFTLPLYCDGDGWIDEAVGRKHVVKPKRFDMQFDLQKQAGKQLARAAETFGEEGIAATPYDMSISFSDVSTSLTFYFVQTGNAFIGWKISYAYDDPG